MQILALIWGILAIMGMFKAFIPFLGWLNWGNISFAIVGLIIAIIATVTARRGNGTGIAAIVLCAIAIVMGALRLKVGLGFF